MRFLDKINRFFQGRNGFDIICKYCLILYFILWIVNIFLRSRIISLVELLLFAYIAFRMLSKNTWKRHSECHGFEKFDDSVRSAFRRMKDRFVRIRSEAAIKKQRAADQEHVYRDCPNCHQTIRLPRKKGTHTVECPKCHKDFKVRILK